MFRELLVRAVSGFCKLSELQIDQLEQHYNLLQRWNRVLNLTRIEAVEDVVERHFGESLFLASRLPEGALRIADVGSGAGFPGIPVAIARPECSVTLVESHQRKAVFLKEASRGLSNVQVVARQFEDVPGPFDWVVSRAVRRDEVEAASKGKSSGVALLVAGDAVGSDIPMPWGDRRKLVMFHVKPLGEITME